MPVFEESAKRTAVKCEAIYGQRGGEYSDTWALENQQTVFVDTVLRMLNLSLSAEAKRLLKLGALIDVKDDRMLGGFKEDSLIDGVNYRLVFNDLMLQFESKSTPATTSGVRPQLQEDAHA